MLIHSDLFLPVISDQNLFALYCFTHILTCCFADHWGFHCDVLALMTSLLPWINADDGPDHFWFTKNVTSTNGTKMTLARFWHLMFSPDPARKLRHGWLHMFIDVRHDIVTKRNQKPTKHKIQNHKYTNLITHNKNPSHGPYKWKRYKKCNPWQQ